MKHLLIIGPVRQKDGSWRDEAQVRRLSEAKGAKSAEEMGIDETAAVLLPRLPRQHERIENGVLIEDLEQRRRSDRDARGRNVSRGELLERITALEARVAALLDAKGK